MSESSDFFEELNKRISRVISSPDFEGCRQEGLRLIELTLLEDIACSLRDIREMLIEWRTYED